MRKRLSGLRLGVLLVSMFSLFSPFAATGAGAQELTCDDFNVQPAAQAVLEAEPSLADELDPDGDGIACNEDEPVDEPTDDPTEEPTDEATDEPSGDAEAYLSDIQAEVDSVVESFNRQVEISLTIGEASGSEQQDLIAELEDLAESWAEYPDVAAEFEAPAGLEDVEEAYLEFADLVGETGDTWLTWWDIPQDDPDEDPAFDDFTEAFEAAYAAAADVTDAIEDAGGSTTPTDDPSEEPTNDPTEEPTDDPTGEPSADGEPYVAEVQAELDDLQEQIDRFAEIEEEVATAELSRPELEELADEINGIAAGWVEYPDVATELVAPEGYEDIEDAYLDLADTVGEAGELWEAYWAIDADLDEEEEIARDAFDEAYADVQDGIDEVQDLLDEAGGSTGPSDDPIEDPTEEPTDDPTEEPSGEADEYLAAVSETAADWNESVTRFSDIIALGPDATEADFTEAAEIVATWLEAPDVAAELEVPAGFEEIQTAYEDYADELSTASGFFSEWVADLESAAGEDALDSFVDAITEAETLYAELEELLTDAGA